MERERESTAIYLILILQWLHDYYQKVHVYKVHTWTLIGKLSHVLTLHTLRLLPFPRQAGLARTEYHCKSFQECPRGGRVKSFGFVQEDLLSRTLRFHLKQAVTKCYKLGVTVKPHCFGNSTYVIVSNQFSKPCFSSKHLATTIADAWSLPT